MTARFTILMGLDTNAIELRLQQRVLVEVVRWPELQRWMRPVIPSHPAEHGAMADAIIAASAHRAVIVATHSDVFVLRVRRRVAEGTLAHSDVALILVEGNEEKPIPLNDRGVPAWWPKGLGAEAQEEFHAMRRALNKRDAAAARPQREAARIAGYKADQERRRLVLVAFDAAHPELAGVHCHASRGDGECNWARCPQPDRDLHANAHWTESDCPLDRYTEDDA